MTPLRLLLAVAALACAWVAHAADVALRFGALAGEKKLDPTAPEFVSIGTNSLSLTRFSGLISSVAFVRPDGSFAQLDGQFGALDLAEGRDSFMLRGVPPGRYQGLQFLVGLRPEINHSDPALWAAGHPLHPLVNNLHWGWQGGYVFLALEGRYRRPDQTLGGWSFHVANDPRLMLVELPYAIEVTGDLTITFNVDLARILDSITLSPKDGADSTHSAVGDRLADHLVENIPASFRISAVQSSPRVLPTPSAAPKAVSAFEPTPRAFHVPAGFPQVTLPADNPLTEEGVALGRRLFNDKRLSANTAQSCASCHDARHSFSDTVPISKGVDGRPGTRNSMPLFNLAWSPSFGWDGAKPRIRDQALTAITSPVEMHADPARVTELLSGDATLQSEFARAFGDATITVDRITRALEQFLLTLISSDSRFDRSLRGEETLTAEEKEGFALFLTEFDPARGRRGADCFHCHGGSLFSDHQLKNTGLTLLPSDTGRAAITGRPADAGKFKTPSLRNVALTAPYMHDGRFTTLEQVVAHYDHGVRRTENLDPNLAKHPDAGLQLTAAEQAALVAFLRTLTGGNSGDSSQP
ncbi:MAG TPA: MbnP family protein [Chthoniobacterales bacterium]|jgi:cytochrome c peroxidase